LLGTDVDKFLPAFFSEPWLTTTRLINRTIRFPAQLIRAIPWQFDINQKGWFIRNKLPLEPFIFPTTNICRWLATKVDKPRYTKKIAARIHEKTEKIGGCCAITTFFPGLSADKGDENREAAIKSLRCVMQIAQAYNSLVKQDHIKVVEAVGGWLTCDRQVLHEDDPLPKLGFLNKSRLVRILARKLVRVLARKFGLEVGDEYVRARVITGRKARENIVSALEEVLASDTGNVSLAIALDPGPLFAVSSWSDLNHLAKEISASPVLNNRVGFNCDTAHWRMAGIDPSRIIDDLHAPAAEPGKPRDDSVSRRLIHTHVADSGKGFLGYLPPDSSGYGVNLNEWLEAVGMAYNHASNGFPKPTGFVSVELELPASTTIMDTAVRKTITSASASTPATGLTCALH
jgi:hypothetical protein